MIDAVFYVRAEDTYLTWLAKHSKVFVLNLQRGLSPNYVMLHTAVCSHISVARTDAEPGGFTERHYVKACAPTREALREWVKARLGTEASFTSTACGCRPLG